MDGLFRLYRVKIAMFVVTVLIVTNAPERLRPAILVNAEQSLDEPGCRRFDVSFSRDGTRCFLYELYDDEAAFQFHLDTPHFKSFETACRDIVSDKRVETFFLADGHFLP